MTSQQDTRAKLWDFLDRVRGLLDQGWFYQGSAPGRDQSEVRITECLDLLALLAEFIADTQRMGDACSAFMNEATELGLSRDDVRRLTGVELDKLALAHMQLATELSNAGNRAIDLIGATIHVG